MKEEEFIAIGLIFEENLNFTLIFQSESLKGVKEKKRKEEGLTPDILAALVYVYGHRDLARCNLGH